MSRTRCDYADRRRRFPRVSGDEPPGETYEGTINLFSPRERG